MIWYDFFCLYSLHKDVQQRANYTELLEHPFVKKGETTDFDITKYVEGVFEKYGDLNEQPS